MKERIPVTGPWITQKEIEYVTDAVTRAWYSNANLEHAREARQRNAMSYKISPYALNLPSGLNMTQEKVKYVCDVLKALLVSQ